MDVSYEETAEEVFVVKGAPLTVAEARAILIADEALALSYEARLVDDLMFGIEELDAWAKLLASAHDRIAAFRDEKLRAP